MTNFQILLIVFGILNLCLLIYCRSLSILVLHFFNLGRSICPPEEVKKRAEKMGYKGVFSHQQMSNPARKQVIQLLAWTGAINFLGCVGFYYLNSIGI